MKGLRSRTAAPGLKAAPGHAESRCGVRPLGLLTAILLALAPASVSGQFSVRPATVDFEAGDAGSTRSLTVENRSTEPMEVRVYLSDYDRTEDGDHIYSEFGTHSNSCAGRLEAFPDELAMEPGASGEIRLLVEDGPESCWAMVFVEKSTLTASGITVAQRIGVKVLAQPASATAEGRVLGLAMDTAAPRAARIDFQNEGTGVLHVDGEIEVRDLAGEIVAVVEVERFRVLPGRTRRIRVPLEDVELEPGRYVLVAILDFGADYLAGGQTVLEVKP